MSEVPWEGEISRYNWPPISCGWVSFFGGLFLETALVYGTIALFDPRVALWAAVPITLPFYVYRRSRRADFLAIHSYTLAPEFEAGYLLLRSPGESVRVECRRIWRVEFGCPPFAVELKVHGAPFRPRLLIHRSAFGSRAKVTDFLAQLQQEIQRVPAIDAPGHAPFDKIECIESSVVEDSVPNAMKRPYALLSIMAISLMAFIIIMLIGIGSHGGRLARAEGHSFFESALEGTTDTIASANANLLKWIGKVFPGVARLRPWNIEQPLPPIKAVMTEFKVSNVTIKGGTKDVPSKP